MEERGVVVSQNGNIAEVAVVRVSACGSNCKSCGGSCNQSQVTVSAVTEQKLNKGDVVRLESSTSNMMLSVFAAYLVPLIFLMIGSIGGTYLFKGMGFANFEALGFASGILLLAVSFFVIRFLGNKLSKEQFKIVSVERSAK